MRIAVVGSINKDIILRVPRHPKPGETLTALETSFAFGGKGANQAVAAARLGAEVVMIGAVGDDEAGTAQLNHFAAEGIKTEAVLRCGDSSGMAYITVDDRGENSIILYPGANYHVTPDWIEANRRYIEAADVLLIQLEIPVEASLAAAEIASRAGRTVIFNPAPVRPIPDRLHALSDIITPNESELALLGGTGDFTAAAEALLARGAKAVLATLGAEGSRFLSPSQTFSLAAYLSVPVVDTTAAGDSYNAAVACSLSAGKSMLEAAGYATAVASLTVSRAGAQPSLPTAAEVEGFLASHREETAGLQG